MRRSVFVLCAVVFGGWCVYGAFGGAAEKGGCEDAATIFITGDELGAMKPCGCFGGQLGGLDRRGVVLDELPKDRRVALDTGNMIAGQSEQDLIKFTFIARAFEMLGYDVVRFTAGDIEAARNQGMLQGELGFKVITAAADANRPAKYTKKVKVRGGEIAVNVAAAEVKDGGVEGIEGLFGGDAGAVNILIVDDCNERAVESVKKSGVVDCLICPSEGDEPIRISEAGEKPLVMKPGRFGKYVAAVKVKAGGGKGRPTLEFEVKKVSEDLEASKEQQDLYKDYQQMVGAAGLLDRHPKFALENGLKYVGTDSCNTACHKDVFAIWSKEKHSGAYATLVKAGSQSDPECAVCHVVGMDYESGFVSEDGPEGLKNVGCEACHGPGSAHAQNPYGVQTPGDSWKACERCHTTEHSGEFAQHKAEYFEKIRHWSEQTAASNVKK